MTTNEKSRPMSEGSIRSGRWHEIDEIRKEVQDELVSQSGISYKDVESFRFSTHDPMEGRIFTYPSHHYIRSHDDLSEHADLIESLLEDRVAELDRWNITTRTDKKPNRHYWVIKSV